MKILFIKSIILFLLIGIVSLANAQQNSGDSTESSESSYIFLPAIYYTPETKWAYGIVFQYYFYSAGKDSLSRPSSFTPVFIYTQKKQIISELGFDLYFQKQKYHMFGVIGYQKFPNSFFGIGNTASADEETYTANKFYTSLSFLKNIYPGLNTGMQFEFMHSKLSAFDQDGLLYNSNIPGKSGGSNSGLGLIADFDTRNNIYYPSVGRYYQVSASFSGSLTGSDYTYNTYNADLREYISLYGDHIMAMQLYAKFIQGDAPFYVLSQFGGSQIMRGYFEGRFRDNHTIVFQSEYRKHIWYKLGIVAFGGLGQVAKDLQGLQLNAFKYAAGLGIRIMIDDDEKVNLRMDYGLTKDSSALYMQFTEAF